MNETPKILSIAALLAGLLVACGSTTTRPSVTPMPISSASRTATEPPMASGSASAARTELLGEWRRVNSCEAYVAALESAGFGANRDRWLVDFGGYWTSQEDIPDDDPCRGAIEVEHSHFFTDDGRFGSRDEHGDQVDDGDYEVDGPRLAFPSHEREFGYGPIAVEYEISDGGALEFVVNVPDECTGACEVAHVWALSAFYPGPFTRD